MESTDDISHLLQVITDVIIRGRVTDDWETPSILSNAVQRAILENLGIHLSKSESQDLANSLLSILQARNNVSPITISSCSSSPPTNVLDSSTIDNMSDTSSISAGHRDVVLSSSTQPSPPTTTKLLKKKSESYGFEDNKKRARCNSEDEVGNGSDYTRRNHQRYKEQDLSSRPQPSQKKHRGFYYDSLSSCTKDFKKKLTPGNGFINNDMVPSKGDYGAEPTQDYFPLLELCCKRRELFVVHLLSYLHFEDLNSLAMVNRCLRLVRNDDRLDQTRTAVLNFSTNNTGNSFYRLLGFLSYRRQIRTVFRGTNRTKLCLKGFFENLDLPKGETECYEVKPTLILHIPEVKILDLSFSQLPVGITMSEICDFFTPQIFGRLFPNVYHLIINHNEQSFVGSRRFANTFQNLTSLTCCSETQMIDGLGYRSNLRNVTISKACILYDLDKCIPKSIERLDIFGARKSNGDRVLESEICDLVLRRSETLQWLRCDISDKCSLQLMKDKNFRIVNW